MTRNMIDVQRSIFLRLANIVRQNGLEHSATEALDAPRYLAGDTNDVDALQRASLVRFEQVHGLGPVAVFQWNGRYSFSLPNSIPVDIGGDNDASNELENAGLASILLAHDENEIRADPYVIVDVVFGRTGSYALTEIEPLFSSQRLYQFRPSLDGCLAAEMWSRTLAICAVGLANTKPSRWLTPILTDFVDACKEPVSRFAGEALLAAVRTDSWHHGYLEIYRAVEALFRVMCVEDFIDDFRAQLGTEPRANVLRSIEDRLMWRMRDDQALDRLVSRLDAACANAIVACLGLGDRNQAARMLYTTRNRLAHGALFGGPVANRDNLLRSCLLLVRGAYLALQVHPLWIPT